MDNNQTGRKMKKGYILIKLIMLFIFPLSSSGSSNGEVLITINGTEITTGEFVHSYRQNYEFFKDRPLNEFLEVFINYKLKVADAKEAGLHESPGLIDEVASHREKLARPYLTDSVALEKLAREAYDRLRYNVNASHIMVRLGLYPEPADTLEAYKKAMEIRERIVNGEPFRFVAMATSDDPSVKQNAGDLGYFTALQMSYPFETFVYNSRPGDLSEPVRTSFGYHIIRVNDINDSFGEARTAHIMIAINGKNEEEAKERADELYRRLRQGESFEKLAREYSDDRSSAQEGGLLPWFGAGTMVNEFEEAAFSLSSPGDFSEPFRTRYGWHIVKLIDRKPLPPYPEISEDLKNRIISYGGERERIIRSSFVNSLKKEYNFRENTQLLRVFTRAGDSIVTRTDLEMITGMQKSQPLFSFAGEQVSLGEFISHIDKLIRKHDKALHANYIEEMYKEYVETTLISFENNRLEEKYPGFRYRVNEYKDGLLLYEITKKRIWSEISPESKRFADFYEQNKSDYGWETRIDATIFTAPNERAARRTASLAERVLSGRRDTEWLLNRVNRLSGEQVVTARRDHFSKGDSELTDLVEWERGIGENIFRGGDNYFVVLVHEVVEPEPKPLEMVKEEVMQDYQDYLEESWLDELRERYRVRVDREKLTAISL